VEVNVHTAGQQRKYNLLKKLCYVPANLFKLVQLLDARKELHSYEIRSGENVRALSNRPWLGE
jgi:hypothetical protein